MHQYQILEKGVLLNQATKAIILLHGRGGSAHDIIGLANEFSNEQLVQAGKSPLTFVCADDRLLAIAKAEGLLVVNPNHHP